MDNTAEIRFDNWTLRGQPRELLHDGARVEGDAASFGAVL